MSNEKYSVIGHGGRDCFSNKKDALKFAREKFKKTKRAIQVTDTVKNRVIKIYA